MRKLRISTLAVAVIILFASCKENSSGPEPEPGEFYSVNSWIQAEMDVYYFWEDYVPDSVNGDLQPEDYFEGMLKEDDIFSYMTDDKETLVNDLNGISYEAGYSPAFGRFNNSDGVFIIVEFIYPGTPAEEAGLERGDIILAINGEDLNINNYIDLYYAEGTSVLSMGMYVYDEQTQSGSITAVNETKTVQKAVLDLNPIVTTQIHQTGGHKIGYMYYAGFVNGTNGIYNDAVIEAFEDFQSQGITDLVIDLRYNPGGSINASVNMANVIVPQNNANDEDVFVRFQYNSFLQDYFAEQEGPDSPNLVVRFDQPQFSMGFDRIYFLTTGSSASASELIINGLEPYMDVYSIGENTFGKFYGSFVLTDDNSSYAVVPVSLKYANALGVTDFRDGLEPDFVAEENIFDPYALGDVNDPLFSTAIEHITQGSVSAKTKFLSPIQYVPLPDPIELRKGNILMEGPIR
jgi:C-terminal processing protease CtpA/Prc